MLLFFTLFFIFYSFWVVLFIFNSMLNVYFLLLGVVISGIVAKVAISTKLYSERNEFIFLQFGFYKLLIQKICINFLENFYLAFEFMKPDNNLMPLLDYLFIENENINENALACNLLNLNFGCVAAVIKNQCIIIHSMNDLFFTPNQLYFLSIESQKINDDNLI